MGGEHSEWWMGGVTEFPYVGQMKVVDQSGQAVSRTQINLCARLYTKLQKLRDYVNKVATNSTASMKSSILPYLKYLQPSSFKKSVKI